MRPVLHHVRHKVRKHKTFLRIALVIFAAGFLVNAINGIYTQNQIVNSFQKNYEKQAITQLQAYSFGLQSLIETRFVTQLDTLNKIANDPPARKAVLTGDYGPIRDKLQNLLKTDIRFDAAYVLNGKGTVTVAVNKENDVSFIGADASYRDYFKIPVSTKQAYIGNVIQSLRGNIILPLAEPVTDDNGNVVAVLATSSFLSNFAKTITLADKLNGLYFALVDAKGTLILDGGNPPTGISNIQNKDPLVTSLVAGETNVVKSEINYRGDKTFAEGTSMDVGNNRFYVASYFLQSKYDRDLAAVKSDYRRTLFTSRLYSVTMFLIGASIVFWIIKHHEAVEEE